MSLTVRSLVALVLLACFPVAALAVAVGIIAVGVYVTDHVVERLGILMVFAGLGVLATIATSLVRALFTRPQPTEGPELTRENAPALWHVVEELASRMQVAGPRRIVLVPEVNAAVWEARGQREMLVGLPLLAGMSRRELASVLAHELGHYAHGHTRLSARTYRWSTFVDGFLDRTGSAFARWILRRYYRLYLVFARSANRAHELQADDWSARLTDPATAAGALQKLAVIDRCWAALTENYLPLSGPARRKAPLALGLAHLMQARPDDPADHAAASERSLFDSHPPAHERIARFRQLAVAADAAGGPRLDARPDPVPAWALLSDADRTLDELERQLLEDDDPRAEWEEIVQLGCQAEAEHLAATAGRTLTDPTVGDLLAAFVSGRPADVVLPLVRGGLNDSELAEAVSVIGVEVLAAAAHLSLAADGRARFALSWTGPRRWQLWYGEPHGWQDTDLEQLVTPAASDPAQAAALVETLRSWGARLDVPLAAGGPACQVAVPTAYWGHLLLTGPMTPGARRPRGNGKIVDLVVFSSGVLLVRPGRVLAFGAHAYGLKATDRCEKIVATVQDPAEYVRSLGLGLGRAPAGRWIPEPDLLDATFTERIIRGSELRITLRSGEILTIRDNVTTVSAGEPLEQLTALCNYR